MNHSHNFYEILYFEHGDITYGVENREYKLKKHDLVFTRPLTYHYLELNSNAEYERHNIAFYANFVNAEFLEKISLDTEVIHCPPGSIISQNFERIKYYKEHLDEEEFQKILSGLLQEILLNLRHSNNLLGNFSSSSPILEKALKYINENLFTIKSISEISNALFITESYFFKLFKEQLKISPKKYINTKRILHAQKLIQCGQRPTDVYEQCGFESYVGFYKQYVKTFGHSPSKEKQTQTV
jgi:AraC-like DNA-binding protein